jgi:hypothetical protein
MEDLRQAIGSLIHRMELAPALTGSVEAATLDRLHGLYAAAERAQHADELGPLFGGLQQFWLSSIDWCSQLSKDIERLLIIYDEMGSGG